MTESQLLIVVGRVAQSASDLELLKLCTELRSELHGDPDAAVVYRFALKLLTKRASAERTSANDDTKDRIPRRSALSH